MFVGVTAWKRCLICSRAQQQEQWDKVLGSGFGDGHAWCTVPETFSLLLCTACCVKAGCLTACGPLGTLNHTRSSSRWPRAEVAGCLLLVPPGICLGIRKPLGARAVQCGADSSTQPLSIPGMSPQPKSSITTFVQCRWIHQDPSVCTSPPVARRLPSS